MYADDANIIITGKTLHELQLKFTALSNCLVHWVSINGLSLNVRKTQYMVFSNKKLDLDNFELKVNHIPIERQVVARFLGVLVDSRLSWKKHITALTKKLNCNVGILMKVKGIFPNSVLRTLYHSFIQSHLNYCSLVWGLGCKSSLNSIFVAQKKAIRIISPGFARYWYDKNTGQTPTHTKPFFNNMNLPNVYTLILQNVLIFMQKVHTSKVPLPIINMFSLSYTLIPETCYNYFNITSTRLKCLTQSIFYEGPRSFNDILPELIHHSRHTIINSNKPNTDTDQYYLNSINGKPFKRNVKLYLMHVQGIGDVEQWEFTNFRLYKGSRSSNRTNNNYISRTNMYNTETNTLRRHLTP